jgi:MscS family membrane protein
VKFKIGLRYDTSAEVIRKICEEVQKVVNDHPVTNEDTLVTFDSFGDSILNIQVLYFISIVDYNDYMHIRQDLNYKIMAIVKVNGADFAFPSQTVFHDYVAEKPQGGLDIV